MRIISSSKEMQAYSAEEIRNGNTIGFIPTMGYLHEGHLALVKKSVSECNKSVMSIFVNPLQFGPNEDFDKYPRDIKRDTLLAKEAGVDVLFYPSADEIYPDDLPVKMTATSRTNVLCGAKRPGHFDGVVSVLTILFHLVQPNKAYFGQKDAQQVAVVKGLVDSFFFPLEIVTVDTVREVDGLAKSSRNVYLSENERNQAPLLYQALKAGKEALAHQSVSQTIEQMKATIGKSTSAEIDYIEILSYPELTKLAEKKGTIMIALAVQFKHARLIDNLIFMLEEEK
ncbi:pantoate--beta-alanine ligase [Jeotgalibacillus proteolyticus]|uniref:Pantothenate synthetase n=1 Tax=Jeotgalibacillus proteolyticus TaxID=2082395 RepID=A0A2S5GE01_9BACL|nr:pantoate--beta-alanine ligase [Jeotgalibacillus proteolyticus]PPA71240.1 pantoate--beta-alanine ligase [Jeotgalibacillus proteolyticus]